MSELMGKEVEFRCVECKSVRQEPTKVFCECGMPFRAVEEAQGEQ